MKPPFRVLMIARLEKDVFSVLHDLTLHGYDPFYQGVETPESMAAALAESEWDIVIHDYDTPSFSLSTALEIIKRYRLDLPLIVLSSLEGEEFVVEAIKAGANDYVRKGDIRRLNSVVESELHRARVRKEINWRGE